MAEVWAAAVVGAGATVYASNQASKTSAAGSAAANQQSMEMYQTSRSDLMPYMDAGVKALNQMDDLNSGDYSSFYESPDYQWTLDQGIKSVDRSAASRGTQYSGGQLAALADYSSGLASQNYSDYYNRLSSLAGLGQASAAGSAANATSTGNTISQTTQNAADTQAAAQLGQGSTYANLAEQLGEAFGKWYGSQDEDED